MRILSAGVVTAAAALATMPTVAMELDSGAHRITEVADDVYAVEPLFAGANGAFIVTDNGVIVVDTHGSPASAATLIDEIARITDQPVRFVVNTHWHVDHHSGNEAYLSAFGKNVSLIAHDTTRTDIPTMGRQQFEGMGQYKTMPLTQADERLQSGVDSHGQDLSLSQREQIAKFSEGQQEFIDAGDGFEFVLPDLTFERSLTLHTSAGPVHMLFEGRAHTGGDVIVYVPERKVVIAGDILTKPILWTWSGYPTDYIETLRAIEALDFDHVVTGHGGPVLQGKEYIRTARQALETLVRYATDAFQAGLTATQAVENALETAEIAALQDSFSDGSEQGNRTFGQMVGWTVERTMQLAESEAD